MFIRVIRVIGITSVKSSIGIITHQGHISKVNANALSVTQSVSDSVTLITSRASCDANYMIWSVMMTVYWMDVHRIYSLATQKKRLVNWSWRLGCWWGPPRILVYYIWVSQGNWTRAGHINVLAKIWANTEAWGSILSISEGLCHSSILPISYWIVLGWRFLHSFLLWPCMAVLYLDLIHGAHVVPSMVPS